MFKGEYIDDATDEAIAENELVTLTVRTASNGETKTIHLSSDSWEDVLEASETMSSAFFE